MPTDEGCTDKGRLSDAGVAEFGKSHTARRIVGETGVLCETDAYFHTQVGSDPERYDFRRELMGRAKEWNFERFCKALDEGVSPVVVDRGNGLSTETRRYAAHAVDNGYRVELREPDSPWWQEIRVLLKYRELTVPVLRVWSQRLAELSAGSHRVSEETIWTHMRNWRRDLRVEEILALGDPVAADSAVGLSEVQTDSRGETPTPDPGPPAPAPQGRGLDPGGSGEHAWLREFLLELDTETTGG